MFVSKGQFYIFIACFAFGSVNGVFLTISSFFKGLTKVRALKIILDIIFCVPMAFLYNLYSHTLKFPSIRAYMLVGVFLGLTAYLKSFNIILAKCYEKLEDNDKALEHLYKLVDIFPDYEEAHEMIRRLS